MKKTVSALFVALSVLSMSVMAAEPAAKAVVPAAAHTPAAATTTTVVPTASSKHAKHHGAAKPVKAVSATNTAK